VSSLFPRRPAARLQALLFALVGLSILVALHQAFFLPWSLTPAAFVIQDDARQFLAWMPRLSGAPVVQGDIIGEYWQDVAPRPYALLYAVAERAGLDPLLFHRLLPVPLLLLATLFAWRVALRLTGAPFPAFVAAALLMAFLVHEDSIFSATPRAFSMPLFLVFLDALLRCHRALCVAMLGVLAGIYPTTAIVGFTMLGLSFLRLRPRPAIDLSLPAVATVGSAAAAILASAVLLGPSAGDWGPTLGLQEARTMPNLMEPEGRSTLVNASGRIGWVCNQRMGFVPENVPCWPNLPWAPLPNILLLVPLILLAVGAARGSPRFDPEGQNRIYLWALLAALIWYPIAIALAFQLHLPSRYTQRILGPLEWLAIGQMLGLWLAAKGGRTGRIVLGAALLALFLTPLPGYQRPADPAALRILGQLPPDARLSGLSEELDFLPALIGRPVLATVEHAIPFHRGYAEQMEGRLAISLAALSSADPAALDAFLDVTDTDILVVDRALVEEGRLWRGYAGVLPREAAEAEAAFAARATALQAVAPGCARPGTGSVLLLDAGCLRLQLSSRAPFGPASSR
jgi:hypothetical protein